MITRRAARDIVPEEPSEGALRRTALNVLLDREEFVDIAGRKFLSRFYILVTVRLTALCETNEETGRTFAKLCLSGDV